MQGEKDDKIIAVCADDPEYRHYNDIKELPPHRLAEIRRFFEDCILLQLLNQFTMHLAISRQYFRYLVSEVLSYLLCSLSLALIRQEKWEQGSCG